MGRTEVGKSLSDLNVNFLCEMVYFILENPRTVLKDRHKEAFFRALLSATGGVGLGNAFGRLLAHCFRYNI